MANLYGADFATIINNSWSGDPLHYYTDFTNLIKKIVETVAPIIAITLRNKSLDGAYFRTAMHLFAAAVLLFARYEVEFRLLLFL